jgi:hypothetical protein
MATLLLTALGTAIGGPFGGAIGAFIGQQADRRILAGGRREGPRLKELSVTTSSYGQPIPRQFGRMRVAGTVIWATDLVESRTKSSSGKGQPSTVAFSYSASFAVALSSTPLERVGRIWADGNLLRGAAGDLKVGGLMRMYCGHGDDPVDPLLAGDKGAQATAFRDCAYVVFEDLQLAEFGNRIPALSFEVFAAGDQDAISLSQLVPVSAPSGEATMLREAVGFSDEGGPLIGSLAAIDQVFPMICTSGAEGLVLASLAVPDDMPPLLPEQLSIRNGQDADSRHRERADLPAREPVALRYYDEQRDYQPGVQRALGVRAEGREAMLDLPATMNADGARQLANGSAQRARWQHERITWRIGELDPALSPGRVVRVPDEPGRWLLRSWEWHDRGIELSLERLAPILGTTGASDPGLANTASDDVVTPTLLVFFETAPDGNADPSAPLLYSAASSSGAGWRGAALFAVQGSALEPIGIAGSRRAVIGLLAEPLGPSPGLLFEGGANLLVELPASDLAFAETDIAGLAAGANRLLVGSEILQFARAEPLGDRRWRLSGLLRGRGGTEYEAQIGHEAGVTVVLLDDRITPIDPSLAPGSEGSTIAASGIADPDPVSAILINPGLSRRPLAPVHPSRQLLQDQAWEFGWTRRARGQWQWKDGVDIPLVEEGETYLAGFGPPANPARTWLRAEPRLRLSLDERAELVAAVGPDWLWVRQIGTHALSQPLPLWFLE